MAIRAGSRSLFNAHTPSGCPQNLHTLFKAFQGRGCLTQLHPLVPTCAIPPLCHLVYAHLPTEACWPPGRKAQSRQAVTLPPNGCLESLDPGFPPTSMFSLFRSLLAKYSR